MSTEAGIGHVLGFVYCVTGCSLHGSVLGHGGVALLY